MGYSTSTPPALLVPAPMGRGNVPAIWAYKSADAEATVAGAYYFSNGDKLGMKVGDFVLVYDSNTPKAHLFVIITVTAGSGASTNASGNNLDMTMA